LDAAGTTAIARCKPTNPNASLANALIELKRDGLPKLAGAGVWKAQTLKALKKAGGDEYLNVEFGWKPLVNDIVQSAVVISEADALINQYVRDAGKEIRRRYVFPPVITESTTIVSSNISIGLVGPTDLVIFDTSKTSQGRMLRHRKVEKYCWFSGAFIYHLPIDPISMKEVKSRKGLLSKIIGLDLTPDTVWGATPWSWAVDWVTNTGDVISNLQSWSIDGMVLRYGYVMEHVIATDTYTFVGETGLKQPGITPPAVQFVAETKQRRRATPFGFGLQYGQFTDRQKGILAALGLSKSGK